MSELSGNKVSHLLEQCVDDVLLSDLNIPQPKGRAVTSIEEGVKAAEEIGYPVLVRPSFVLGGRAMQIVAKEKAINRRRSGGRC